MDMGHIHIWLVLPMAGDMAGDVGVVWRSIMALSHHRITKTKQRKPVNVDLKMVQNGDNVASIGNSIGASMVMKRKKIKTHGMFFQHQWRQGHNIRRNIIENDVEKEANFLAKISA